MSLPFEGMRDVDGFAPSNEPHISQLYNWELREGGLTPRPAWLNSGQPLAPSPFQIRGLNTRWREGGVVREIQVAHYDGTNYDFYAHDVTRDGSPEWGVAAWSLRDSNVVVGSSYRGVPVSFAPGKISGGNDVLYYGNPGFSSRRGRYQSSGGAAAQIATDNTAGYAAAFHLERFWSGVGGNLIFSEIGSITNWNVTENFIPVGSGNMEIFALLPWDSGMLVGKGDGLWWLAGKTLDTFQRVPVTEKVGVAPGAVSMVETPYGVFFIGTDSNLWQYDGSTVRRVNKNYRLSSWTDLLSGGGVIPTAFFSLAWVYDRLFISSFAATSISTTGIQTMDVYVPELDAFYRETLAQGASDVVTSGYLEAYSDSFLIHAPSKSQNWVDLEPVTFRQQDGQLTTSVAGSSDRRYADAEPGLTRTLEATWQWTPNTVGKTTIKEVFVRYYHYLNASDPPPGAATLQITSDEGGNVTRTFGTETTPGEYVAHLEFGVTGRHFDLIDLKHLNVVNEVDSFKILEVAVGYLTDLDRR
jgi:hypothetical protein